MKSLHLKILMLGVLFLINGKLVAQSIAEERVERYLYTSYDAIKSSMKETDRIITHLQYRLEDFTLTLSKEELKEMKEKEAAFNAFLKKIDEIKDHRAMEKLVENSKLRNKILIATILDKGIHTMKEAQECRLIIVLQMIEKELLKAKNEKLLVLLKDNYSRSEFISTILSSGEVSEDTDPQYLMMEVDKNLLKFNI